jgi:DNA mismatch endonuclease (patch repair protein)
MTCTPAGERPGGVRQGLTLHAQSSGHRPRRLQLTPWRRQSGLYGTRVVDGDGDSRIDRGRPSANAAVVARTPLPSNATVSSVMRKMGRRDTAPEIALRRALTALGLRYRLHRKDLPGKPDICFGPARLAVFVDGCFWHSCPEHGAQPKANRAWWAEKLSRNRERDQQKNDELVALGWLPLHVWEHETPETAATRIAETIRERTDRR